MRLSFQCHVVTHVSGRVTVSVVELPDLAVHAATVAEAVEELTLALDDRIARAHPKRLFDLCRPSTAEPLLLEVPSLRVRGAEEDEKSQLKIYALHAPAHRPFEEVRAPLDTRLWFEGKDWRVEAEALLEKQLEPLDDAALLELRPEGVESWIELVIDATPTRLSSLKRNELTLDERSDAPDEEESDDWDDDPRRRRRKTPQKKPRPPAATLERIGVPWHTLAAEGALEPAYEQEALVAKLRARLEVEDPEPLVLVGPAGSGKTAILQELARKLAAEEALKKKDERDPRPIFYADGPRLIAGQGFYGDWQKQALDVIREARAGKAILVLGHLVELLDAGKSAHSEQNLAELLGPALAAREVPVLGEATVEEWARIERRNAGFARLFTVQRVDEPAPEVVSRILDRVAKDLAQKIVIEPAATAEVQALCRRFLPYGALVGNAVSLLRRLIDGRAHALAERVTAGDAIARLASESGIPRLLLDDAQPLDEKSVRAFLAARVKGQEAAVARAAQVVSVIKANLADRQRPTAVLLFAGPTGVGKTELSKALAELLFGSRDRLVRLDMGELAGPDALVRLVGDGKMPGHLTRGVRRQPFSVVLLDEIEKAHPAVFDALLGVLGEGRLTDASGRLTDFRSTVVILTSNLGADTRRERLGFGGGESGLEAHYRGEAQRFFRPEFYNRLDEIVVFRSLEAAEIRAIVDRELQRVSARDGFRRRDLQLQVGDAARDQLAARGLDARYGARPLKRTIERLLIAPVAGWLAGHPQSGATRLEVGDELRLSATSLGGSEEGVSRGRIERVLERAASVRGEVRRWSRSGPMVRLTQELSLFDRLSRQPSFWHDRALADERARAAASGRELSLAFAAAEKRAEATEDLAYEAYYARQPASAETLLPELDEIDSELIRLGEGLFASLFPPRNSIALVLTAGRTGWPHLCVLAGAIDRWVERRSGTSTWFQPIQIEPETKKKTKTWRWGERRPAEHDPGAAAVVRVTGTPALMLLSAEHGAHRFTSGGDTAIVKVGFQPRPPARYHDEDPAELEKTQPSDEIRRLWPQKKLVEDLRLKRRFELGEELDLEPLLAAYQRWRILDHGEEP